MGQPYEHLKQLRTPVKEQDSTATEQQVSGQCGTTVGADDSETCTITWSHIAWCDDGRDTAVDPRRATLHVLRRCTA